MFGVRKASESSLAEQPQLAQDIISHPMVLHDLNDSSYGCLDISRPIAQSVVRCFAYGLRIMVVGDSQMIIDGLLG